MSTVSTQHFRQPLSRSMHLRLQDCGTWMSRDELAEGLSTCSPAIDDALADLVLDGRVEYRHAVGYRLKGTELARSAVKKLRAEGLCRAVIGRQVNDQYRVGVAEQRKELGLVMYELALPMPPDGPQHLEQHMRQVDAVVAFSQRNL